MRSGEGSECENTPIVLTGSKYCSTLNCVCVCLAVIESKAGVIIHTNDYSIQYFIQALADFYELKVTVAGKTKWSTGFRLCVFACWLN